MMYNELFEIWKRERESKDLAQIPPDFYVKASEYIKRLKEEERMLDKKTVKAILLAEERRNVKRIIRELMRMRYEKIVRILARGEKPSADVLVSQEEKIISGSLNFAEAFRSFVKNVLQGRLSDSFSQETPKRILVRFLKDVPSIVGADMKIYGPFKCEDVASLPVENAKILIRQELAKAIET
ncbi:MAG: hypothetical protein N3F10_05895 [Candidatus Bathyarchaeota archaeon]|nr:hypothetical protein [Candidatus Bathyarchaeota archaeon]